MNWIIINCSNICTQIFQKHFLPKMKQHARWSISSPGSIVTPTDSGFKETEKQNSSNSSNSSTKVELCDEKTSKVNALWFDLWRQFSCTVQPLKKMDEVFLCAHVRRDSCTVKRNLNEHSAEQARAGWLTLSPIIPVKRQYSKDILHYNTKVHCWLILNNRQKLLYILNIQYLLF